jgi:protein-S-isoprenylcysteine O-methyltransferase Ste14
MPKLTIFAVASVAIVLLSWKSLRNMRSHGFFRFFVFECSLGLLLLNVDYWFREPFSIIHIVSWILLLSSLVMVVNGFYLLRVVGRPKRGIENTTMLVRRGIFKYIRHPLYSSLLLFGWGVFFKNPSLLSASLVVVASAFLIAAARVEEKENVLKFGDQYAAYMKKTKMFIPFVI